MSIREDLEQLMSVLKEVGADTAYVAREVRSIANMAKDGYVQGKVTPKGESVTVLEVDLAVALRANLELNKLYERTREELARHKDKGTFTYHVVVDEPEDIEVN